MNNLERLSAAAKKAESDLRRNYWNESENHFDNYTKSMTWEYGIILFGLETLYKATGEQRLKEYFLPQMKYVEEVIGLHHLLTVCGTDPNIANDDTGWSAMTMISTYRMSGYGSALGYARDIIRNSYEYFKDGDISNGLWYRLDDKYNPDHIAINQKCITCAALVLASLDLYEITKGSAECDEELFADTLTLYNWIEEKLARVGVKDYGNGKVSRVNDGLYYMSLGYDTELDAEYPKGVEDELAIYECNSISSLFGNMAMPVINAKLYNITKEKKYLERAINGANALINSKAYTGGDIFLNDRDAWCNSTFAGRFVSEVLTLDGVNSARASALFKNTAEAILDNCVTEDGRYRGSWGGSGKWDRTSGPNWMMTNGTTVHMIYAALLCEKLGL